MYVYNYSIEVAVKISYDDYKFQTTQSLRYKSTYSIIIIRFLRIKNIYFKIF